MSVRVLHGDVRAMLRTLEPESVHCIWTSPPYFGLRSYGTEPQVWGGDPVCEHAWQDASWRNNRWGEHDDDKPGEKQKTNGGSLGFRGQVHQQNICQRCGAWRGEHGLEPSLALWLENEVTIWRELRRVLRKDGCAWLNCGDAYSSNGGGAVGPGQAERPETAAGGVKKWERESGLAAKQRLMLPARLALALQVDGWWLRDEICLHKLNPMPSSVTDRTTPAHEMLYLLTREPRYFYDAIAIQEKATGENGHDLTGNGHAAPGQTRQNGNRARHSTPRHELYESCDQRGLDTVPRGTRNKRSVWSHASSAYSDAHFATANPAWVETCILASTSARGVCPDCGAQWMRETEKVDTGRKQKMSDGWDTGEGGHRTIHRNGRQAGESGVPVMAEKTLGWRPGCSCGKDPVPATVLDPFGGSGTTGAVADQLGRHAILIELGAQYIPMIEKRLRESLPGLPGLA